MADEQHDAHTILFKGGGAWRIRWVDPPSIGLWHGSSVATVDMRKVDWERYCRLAQRLLQEEQR